MKKETPVACDKITKYDPELIAKIDPMKFYKVTIQIGGYRSWGVYTGQKRVLQTRTDGSRFIPKYAPTVCAVEESITGKVLAGLMVDHNDWLAGFKQKDPLCEPDYQLAVLSYEETTEVPPGMSKVNAQGMFHIEFLEQIVNGIIKKNQGLATSPGKA